MQQAMIYFACAVICPLAIHESRKWLLIKDIFQFKKWRFSFLTSESKRLIPYPSFGGEWSLVGDFRKKLLSCPCPSGSQSTNAKLNCPFHWSGSACVSPYGQKHAAARF